MTFKEAKQAVAEMKDSDFPGLTLTARDGEYGAGGAQ